MNNRIKSHLEKNEMKIINKLRKFNFNEYEIQEEKINCTTCASFFSLPFNLEILDIVFEILEGR